MPESCFFPQSKSGNGNKIPLCFDLLVVQCEGQNLIEFSKLVGRNLFEVNHQVQLPDRGKLQLHGGDFHHPGKPF